MSFCNVLRSAGSDYLCKWSGTRFIWEKKKHTIISEISFCNVLRSAGSDYLCKWSGTFAGFRLKIFTQEKNSLFSLYGDPCP